MIHEADRQSWFEKLAERLQKNDRVKCFISQRNRKKPGSVYLGLQILGKSNGNNPHDYMNLQFERRDAGFGLWIVDKSQRKIKTARPFAGISDLAQLEEMIKSVHAQQDRTHLRRTRGQKVAGLKQTGLMARLKEFGREHNVAFAMGQNKRDIQLGIRLQGRKRGYHFTFPKGKLDEVIETLPELMATLERFQKMGIAFQGDTKRWRAKIGEWIEPTLPDQSPEDDEV